MSEGDYEGATDYEWAAKQVSNAGKMLRQGEQDPRAVMRDLAAVINSHWPHRSEIEFDLPQVEVFEHPRLDDVALHGLAGDIVRTIEPHTEADKAALLGQFLVMFGNAVGREPYAMVNGTRHGTNLYLNVVGATAGGRKGSSYGEIRYLFQNTYPEWLRSCIATGLTTGEGIIKAVEDKRDPETDEVNESSEKRLMVVEEEFGRVFSAKNRDGSVLSQVLRPAWDGKELGVMTRSRPLRADKSHVSIIGHITLEELKDTLSDQDARNGFANRFLWLLSEKSKDIPEPTGVPNLLKFTQPLRRVIDRARERPRLYQRSEGARRRWYDYYMELSQREARGLYSEIVARMIAQTLRVSVIYAVLDQADEVRLEHLEAAIGFVGYCDQSALCAFGGAVDSISEKILKVADDAAPNPAPIGAIYSAFTGNISRRTIKDRLERLEEQELVELGKADGRRGKPITTVLHLNPPSLKAMRAAA